MKNSTRRLLPLAILSLTLIALAPTAYASTLNVNLNPQTKVANIRSVSMTSIVLTYPDNSSLSKLLNGFSSSKSFSGNFSGSSEATDALQRPLEDHDDRVRIQNMSVSYSLKAVGNSTALVINKETDIMASVSGVFTVVNGTVHANLRWKAFVIPGEMTLTLGDRPVEINLVGSAMTEQLEEHPILSSLLLGMFGGDELWHRPTLNFSSLDTPLSNWTKSYNSLTNTTTFSKTIAGQSSLYVSADYNGQKYTLSVKSDPSANIVTQGYATPSGDGLIIGSAPLYVSAVPWLVGGVVVVAALAAVAYTIRRSRMSSRSQAKAPAFPTAVG